MKNLWFTPQYLLTFFLVSTSFSSLTACQKNPDTPTISQNEKPSKTAITKSEINLDTSKGLAGCYTVSKTEPAQIKINEENGAYTMQMRQFNDPDKPWDKPEPLQILTGSEIKTYLGVEEKSVEKALIRPDKVFAIAKVQDSLMNLDARFDSNYLGYLAKSETAKGSSATIYKVKCESK